MYRSFMFKFPCTPHLAWCPSHLISEEQFRRSQNLGVLGRLIIRMNFALFRALCCLVGQIAG